LAADSAAEFFGCTRAKMKEGLELKICCVCNERLQKPIRCSGCHLAYYCGVVCQRGDWPEHKGECKHPDAYSAGALCDFILARIMTSEDVRNSFAAQVKAKPGALGICVRISNQHQARIALTRQKLVAQVGLIMDPVLYQGFPPFSRLGKRDGDLDYVIRMEVKESHGENLYSVSATAAPFDYADQTGQRVWHEMAMVAKVAGLLGKE